MDVLEIKQAVKNARLTKEPDELLSIKMKDWVVLIDYIKGIEELADLKFDRVKKLERELKRIKKIESTRLDLFV